MDNDTVKVEHVFTFCLGDKWDRPLRKAVDNWLDITYHYAESFRFIAIGFAAYLCLAGAAKVIDAGRKDRTSSSSKK